MGLVCVKGHADEIEFCFAENIEFSKAAEELGILYEDKKSFFEHCPISISYSGLSLSYDEEMQLEKLVKKLFGDKVSLKKKHKLTKEQIDYSLEKGETTCLVVKKSLRSGETVISRGDLIVYGDVNPGALVKAHGNITVIGALRGVAHITGRGRVYATYMQPTQIRIGKLCSYNKKSENVAAAIAIAKKGEIFLQCL